MCDYWGATHLKTELRRRAFSFFKHAALMALFQGYLALLRCIDGGLDEGEWIRTNRFTGALV